MTHFLDTQDTFDVIPDSHEISRIGSLGNVGSCARAADRAANAHMRMSYFRAIGDREWTAYWQGAAAYWARVAMSDRIVMLYRR